MKVWSLVKAPWQASEPQPGPSQLAAD